MVARGDVRELLREVLVEHKVSEEETDDICEELNDRLIEIDDDERNDASEP